MTAVVVERTPEDGRLLVRRASLGRRRPVLSFVGVLVLLAVVLLGVERSGVVAPQAELQHTISLGDGSATYAPAYSLVNHGLRPVEVVAVRSSSTVLVADAGEDLVLSGSATLPDLAAFAPFTIPAGGRRDLVVDLGPPCPGGTGFGTLSLEVVVRSADAGVRATLAIPEELGVC